MFNKLKVDIFSPTRKQLTRLILAKDLKQYKIKNKTKMSHLVGRNWPLGFKFIDINTTFLIKIFKIILIIIIFMYLMFLFI